MNRIEANIAGTKIPLKVSEEEEVFVTKAIEEINSRIKQYQAEYSQKDIQECILMTLLTYAVDYHKIQNRTVDETAWNRLIDIRNQLQVMEVQSQD
jgi:hypothetical protein